MIAVKFDICSEVFFFNTASCKIESGEIKGMRIIPTGISHDEKGKSKLDSHVVLYEIVDGPMLAESELFASEEECKNWYLEFFQRGGHITQ